MSKYATHNWYTLAFDADAIANVIPEDYEYRNGKVWEGDELSHAIEWMREYNEQRRTLFRVSVSVEAVDIEGVSPPQPGPVKPWHEYHGNEKVHMPKYPVLSRQENHMNDTTRDELREDVADAFRAFVSEMGGGEDWSQAYYDHADRTIALVTAARDAEIREALEAEYERVKEENTGLMGDYDLETAGTLSGLSFAIGLTEEGAER